jgi:hypothetical protein
MTISDQELDRRLAALDRRCDPPDEVWERIPKQLPRHHSRSGWPWLAMAAALAGLAIGLLVMLADPEWMAPESPPGLAEQSDAEPWRPTVQHQPVFDAAWQENEAAIRRLEQALVSEPDNLLLREFLVEARFRQSALVELALRTDGLSSPTGEQP